MTTVKALVFELCDKYGDQTSIEFLVIKLKPIMVRAQNKILTQQKKLIKETGLNPDEFFENEKTVAKARKKMVLYKVLRLADAWGRLIDPKALRANVTLARVMWRKEKEIVRDCRKYKGGQPARNMVKAS
jgi:hypothetical protein